MIDLIKSTIFPKNVVAGVASGYSNSKLSYFTTNQYNYNDVMNSRELLEREIGNSFSKYYYQNQIHSDIVLDIENYDNNLESDSIICRKSGIILNVSIADCQAILIYDPISKVVAAIHSGWKGTKLNIVNKTVTTLKKQYNVKPSNILVFLSPSASVDNYEVGKEFLEFFPNSTLIRNEAYYFDNRNEIIHQLIDSGIKKENIESLNDCTIINNRYHSYRRDKEQSGRMSAFIGIKQ